MRRVPNTAPLTERFYELSPMKWYTFKPVILPNKFSGACMKTRTTRYPLWVIWWMRKERFWCKFSSALSDRTELKLKFLLVGYKCCLRTCFTCRSTLRLKKGFSFGKIKITWLIKRDGVAKDDSNLKCYFKNYGRGLFSLCDRTNLFSVWSVTHSNRLP